MSVEVQTRNLTFCAPLTYVHVCMYIYLYMRKYYLTTLSHRCRSPVFRFTQAKHNRFPITVPAGTPCLINERVGAHIW